MDLCLPHDWAQRAGEMFRDDLGPQPKAAARAFVCGLRDLRVTRGARTRPFALAERDAGARPTPLLVPYRAPDWLRSPRPARA